MLPQSHFIAFNDKIQTFFKRVKALYSLYVISCIRRPIAQKLDKINIWYVRKFCR